uniref:Zn(2)-C6 fungal-type domain-containing protein n=1 Tax=Chrysotila carterae TaxID=13221 RepID=A0A7S4C1P9_CHRCT
MPPLAWVCIACKSSKTKCVNFAPGKRCDRCARIGLRCEPAPQRARQQSHKSLGPTLKALLDPQGGFGDTVGTEGFRQPHSTPFELHESEASTSALTVLPGPALHSTDAIHHSIHSSEPNIFADFWIPSTTPGGEHRITQTLVSSGVPHAQLARAMPPLLRNWAAIARRRNAYQLMAFSIFLSRKFDVPMDDVLPTGCIRDLEGGALQIPLAQPIAEIVAASTALTVARVTHEGIAHFATNCRFENRICPRDELAKCWRANQRETLSLFAHEDDIWLLHEVVAKLWLHGSHGDYTTATSTQPVRILDRVIARYLSCDVVGTFIAEERGTKESWVLEFKPQEEVPVGDISVLLGNSGDSSTRVNNSPDEQLVRSEIGSSDARGPHEARQPDEELGETMHISIEDLKHLLASPGHDDDSERG